MRQVTVSCRLYLFGFPFVVFIVVYLREKDFLFSINTCWAMKISFCCKFLVILSSKIEYVKRQTRDCKILPTKAWCIFLNFKWLSNNSGFNFLFIPVKCRKYLILKFCRMWLNAVSSWEVKRWRNSSFMVFISCDLILVCF